MVRTADNLHTIIESLSDPTHPVALCTLSANAEKAKFISPTEIGYAISRSPQDPISGVSDIQRMTLRDKQPLTVATFQGDSLDVGWSPDGTSVAYLAYTNVPNLGSGDANQLWLKVGNAAPRALTPLIPLFGRDASLDDQTIVRFSPDGKYLLMVDTYVAGAAPASADQAMIQIRSVPDGALVWVPPTALGVSGGKGGPFITMAAWSPTSDRLFYRDQAGVHTWDPPAKLAMLAAGLAWSSPSLSPDGRYVAYTAYVNGQPHVEIRDLVSASVRVLPGTLGLPTLLSDQEIIESHFVRNTQVGSPYLATGFFVLNLLTNKETPLPGTIQFKPIDTWPH